MRACVKKGVLEECGVQLVTRVSSLGLGVRGPCPPRPTQQASLRRPAFVVKWWQCTSPSSAPPYAPAPACPPTCVCFWGRSRSKGISSVDCAVTQSVARSVAASPNLVQLARRSSAACTQRAGSSLGTDACAGAASRTTRSSVPPGTTRPHQQQSCTAPPFLALPCTALPRGRPLAAAAARPHLVHLLLNLDHPRLGGALEHLPLLVAHVFHPGQHALGVWPAGGGLWQLLLVLQQVSPPARQGRMAVGAAPQAGGGRRRQSHQGCPTCSLTPWLPLLAAAPRLGGDAGGLACPGSALVCCSPSVTQPGLQIEERHAQVWSRHPGARHSKLEEKHCNSYRRSSVQTRHPVLAYWALGPGHGF